MKRKRRGARPRWIHAGGQSATFTPNAESGVTNTIVALLLPPERVRYLCDTSRKDHMTSNAILLWLDFYWVFDDHTGSGGGQQTAGPVDFYIMKTEFDSSTPPTDVPLNFLPYREPDVPANITSWDAQTNEPDGLDAYLWTHHWSGVHRNSIDDVTWSSNASGTVGAPNGGIGNVVPYDAVRQAWQPDVVVKTRRRLNKNEGLFLGFVANNIPQTGPAYLRYTCNAHWRILGTV